MTLPPNLLPKPRRLVPLKHLPYRSQFVFVDDNEDQVSVLLSYIGHRAGRANSFPKVQVLRPEGFTVWVDWNTSVIPLRNINAEG